MGEGVMVKTFFALLIVGVLLIAVVGIVLSYVPPLPTTGTEETDFVDDIAFDRAVLSADFLAMARLKTLQKIKTAVAWFSAILFLTLLIALAFSRMGGANIIMRARWDRTGADAQRHSAYRPPQREEKVSRHYIDPNNP